MRNYPDKNRAFSLAEVIVALVIASMLLSAVLAIYSRMNRSASAIHRKLDENSIPNDVLQRIAEDLDSVLAASGNTKIEIKNTTQEGYEAGRLKITRTYYSQEGEEQILEEIVWQTGYDFQSNLPGLVLYRSHKGLASQDEYFDDQREEWEKDFTYIPVCEGITQFIVEAAAGEKLDLAWEQNDLPFGVKITVSFSQPAQNISGDYEILEEDKTIRTIAIDRTRKPGFQVINSQTQQTIDVTESQL